LTDLLVNLRRMSHPLVCLSSAAGL